MDFFEKILIGTISIVLILTSIRIFQEGLVEMEIINFWVNFLMVVTPIAAGYEGVKNFKGVKNYSGKETGDKKVQSRI